MKKLYKFELDCGRMGWVDSIFIAEEDDVKNAYGKQCYFGEILGKHSEVFCDLNEDMITEMSDDQERIDWLRSLIVRDTISGYNPLEYLEWEEDDDE